MKKGIALFFIVVVLVNLFGYFISFSLKRHQIREEVSDLMKAEKLSHTQQFVFTAEEYKGLAIFDDGREFALDGALYDIVSKEIKDGKIIITAYNDSKETSLVQRFVSYITTETPSDKASNLNCAFSLLEFVFSVQQWQWNNPTLCLFIRSESSNLFSQFLTTETPPPDITLS